MTNEEVAAIHNRKLDVTNYEQSREKRTMQFRLVEENGVLYAEGLGAKATVHFPGAFLESMADTDIVKKSSYAVTYTAIRLGETSLELMDGDRRWLARREDFEVGTEPEVVMRWKIGKPIQVAEDENE
jgi:hypothetical protein